MEQLGTASLELDADLKPLDAKLVAAEARVERSVATMQAMLDTLHAQVDMKFSGLEALAQRLAAGSGTPIVAPGSGSAAQGVTRNEIWGVRGPEHPGSLTNPIVTVLEAGERTTMGSYAAAIGENTVADTQRGDQASGVASAMDMAALTAAVSDLARNMSPASRLASMGGGPETTEPRVEAIPVSLDDPSTGVLRDLAGVLSRLEAQAAQATKSTSSSRTTIIPGGDGRGRGATTVIDTSRTTINTGGSSTTIIPTSVASHTGSAGSGTVAYLWPGGGGNGGNGFLPPLAAGGGGGGNKRVDVFYHASGGDNGGGAAGPGLFASLLGMGTGTLGLAGLGTAGSFAGLGFEHVLTTILGLIGSAGSAAVGGGVLGLGALGTIGVGAGSDIGVMKSTITDTMTLSKDMTALSQAVAVYGKNSTQARTATAQLNADMKALGNTAGVQAEAGLAKSATALDHFFDLQTSGARVQAVHILMQAVQAGYTFVPLIAQAAQSNLAAINNELKPLTNWLTGPQGIQIFHDLENVFAHNLPFAMGAFDNAVELFLRVADLASQDTGGFVKHLDALFTRLNNMSNAQIDGWVQKMIADFRLWETFLKLIVEDIYGLFHQDVGTGNSIISTLNGMLEKLHQYEQSSRGSAQLQSLFMVHQGEVKALLGLIPILVKGFGALEFALAPTLTTVFTDFVKYGVTPLADALGFIADHSKAAALGIGLFLIAFKAGQVGTIINFAKGLAGLGAAEVAAGAGGTAAAGAAASAGAASSVAAGAAGGAAASGAAGVGAKVASGAFIEDAAVAIGSFLVGHGASGAGVRIASLGMTLADGFKVALPAAGVVLAANFIDHLVHANIGSTTIVSPGQTIHTAPSAGGTFLHDVGQIPIIGGIDKSILNFGAGLLGINTGTLLNVKKVGDFANYSAGQLAAHVKEMKAANSIQFNGVNVAKDQAIKLAEAAEKAAQKIQQATNAVNADLNHWYRDTGRGLASLTDDFQSNMAAIAHYMGVNSTAGRQAVSRNVDEMVQAVTRSMLDGKVSVSQGMNAIDGAIKQGMNDGAVTWGQQWKLMMTTVGQLFDANKITHQQYYSDLAHIEATGLQHIAQDTHARMVAANADSKQQLAGGLITHQQYMADLQNATAQSNQAQAVDMAQWAANVVGTMIETGQTSANGVNVILGNLNKGLKALGATQLSLVGLTTAGVASSVTSGVTGVVGALGGITGATHSAGGSLWQIGSWGEAGRDSVPMNVGGVPIMVAPGEQVAVFNRHQIPEVNAALADRGYAGLPGLFSSIQTPNYMAKGGTIGAPGVTGSGALATMVGWGLKDVAKAATDYLSKQKAKAKSPGGGSQVSGAGIAPGSWMKVATEIAGKHGWDAAEVLAWLGVEQIEDGSFSLTAKNPTSQAIGLAQFINGAGEYAQYGGSYGNLVGELVAMGNYIACVPLDTEILTRDGWKRHDEVRVGDETLGYDPDTGRSRWTPITHVHHYEDAPVVELSCKRWRSRSTGNHRWLADKLIQSDSQPTYRREEMVRTDAIGTRHRLRLAAPADTDSSLPVTTAEAEILGWVMGDGHIRQRGNCRDAWVDQIKPRWMDELRALMSNVPHVERVTVRADGAELHRFRMSAPYVRDLLARSRYDAGWERMVLLMSAEQRAGFLQGIYRADGHGRGGARSPMIAQNSGAKLDAILLAGFLEGHYCNPTASADQVHVTLGKSTIKGGAFRRSELGPQAVWCVTTELGTWTMRQDGRTMLTGNSRYGTPAAALAHEHAFGHYSRGGTVATGAGSVGGAAGIGVGPVGRQFGGGSGAAGIGAGAIPLTDLQQIAGQMAILNQLIGPAGQTGAVGNYAEMLSYFPQSWAINDPLFGQSASSYIVSTDASGNAVTPYINQSEVSTNLARLNLEYGWENSTIADLRQAQSVAVSVEPKIKTAITRRQNEIKAIQAKANARVKKVQAQIRANLKQIAALQKQIATLQSNISNEQGKSKPNRSLINGWNKQINSLNGQITTLQNQNQQLGGDQTQVGTGGDIAGILGTAGKAIHPINTEITGLQNDLQLVQGYPTMISGQSGLGGMLGSALIQDQTIANQIASLSPANLDQALAAANTQSSGAGSAQTSALLSLYQQLNMQLAEELAVSQAQYSVLGNLPPFGGSFATGGVVPGPLGAARMIEAHGGEIITPPSQASSPDVHVHFHGKAKELQDFIDWRVEAGTRSMAKGAMRPRAGQNAGRLALR